MLNLIGGLLLIVLYTLVKNRIEINLNILADTRANRFVFINTTFVDNLYKGLSLQRTPLGYIIKAKGYNRQSRQVASYYITMNLIIEGCRQYNIPFIILNLGVHEAILGCK